MRLHRIDVVRYIAHRRPRAKSNGRVMLQIATRVPDSVARALDEAASQQGLSRADLVRQIIEQYVEDFDDLSVAVSRLRDPWRTGIRSGAPFSIRTRRGAIRALESAPKGTRRHLVHAVGARALVP